MIPRTAYENLLVQTLNAQAVLAKGDGAEGLDPGVTGTSSGIFLSITTTQGLPGLNTGGSM